MRTKHFVSPGDRFGRLVVVELTSVQKPGQPKRRAAICRCDCEAQVTVLLQALVRQDGTRSCGCMKRRGTMSARFAETRATPDRLNRTSHRLSNHASYHRWYNMIDRCGNPAHAAYRNYGARGITVCPEWHDPAAFLKYLDEVLGPCPVGFSLDRIDNDGPYAPGNIRWASAAEQTRNRRAKP